MEKELPKGWCNASLQEIVKSRKGKKPKILSESFFPNSIPYLDIKALEKNVIRQYADKSSSVLLTENELAIVWDGARSGWVSKGIEGALGSTLASLSPKGVKLELLFYFLQSSFELLNTQMRGIGIPHLDPSILWGLNFPLPPLNEQKRIAEKLDALFGHLDILKGRLEEIPKLLKQFRQQVLTQAVTGKLTEDWRKENKNESAVKLLSLIKKDLELNYTELCKNALARGIRKPKNPLLNKKAIAREASSQEFPENWILTRAEEICYLITDGVHHKPNYTNSGTKFLSVKNVRPFKINHSDCKFISDEDHKKFSIRSNPEYGDLLYTKVGATFGYAALIKSHFEFSIFVSLALIKPSRVINSQYLELLFNSDFVFDQARNRVSGSGVPDLHLIEIRDFTLPLPPKTEQAEIVRRVEKLFAFADGIESKYQVLKTEMDKLPQSILAKAFRGELVPQDPADEPASELLKRIRQEKDADKKSNPKTIKKKNLVMTV